METLPSDILEIILQKCVSTGNLYYGFICSCRSLNAFGKQRLIMLKQRDFMQAIINDDIERIAVYVHFLNETKDIDDCIKLCLLNGSVKVSWWLWNQYRPCLTMQILMDIENKMFMTCRHDCNEILYGIMKSIRCAYEAANYVQDI